MRRVCASSPAAESASYSDRMLNPRSGPARFDRATAEILSSFEVKDLSRKLGMTGDSS